LRTAQLQYLNKPFSTIYEKECKKTCAEPEYVTLQSGCRAFWPGDKAAKNVIIYFHGMANSYALGFVEVLI
jgi:hypothetical protein